MNKKQSTKGQDLHRLKAALDLYDNAPCGSICFHNDGLIFDINNTLAVWLGFTKEEIINKRTLPSLFKIGGQIFFETHFFPLIKLQGFIKEVYFDVVRKDKSVLHGLINVREIPAQDDAPLTYQATVLDMSDRWHFEAELLKAKQQAESDSKAKADFLSTISHEIRTPLNAILGIGNLLHKTPLNKNQKDYARLLLHSSEHLLSLVNNLLDLSKIEARKFELEHVDFDVFDLSKILEQTFSVRAKEKGIEMRVDLDTDVPRYLIGDPVKLNQILTNLVGNAIKFTKIGSVTLSISVAKMSKQEVYLDFKVADTGIGIPSEKLESIFQEFSQASYDVNVEFGGTGLGLTISKKLLELHGSKLSVSSKLNVGSKFKFRICYKKSDKVLAKKDLSILESEKHDFGDLMVLLVDDNPANIFIAEQYLEQWNISYLSAESGKKALSMITKHKVDLILLDLQMPKMDGYETAKNIRDLKLNMKPVIIAFSASTKGEVNEQLMEAGIDDHLPKPFQPKQLYEILLRHQNVNPQSQGQLSSIPKKSLKKSMKKSNPKLNTPKVSFKLDRYIKMANNKPEYLKKFKLSTLDALISYQKDYNKAIVKNDIKMISDLIHKSTMSLYYIEADPLTELLMESRSMLQAENKDESLLNDKVTECNKEFIIIINGLTEKD
ncbi:PAS domain-containing hybrid sensor histidine kinase/response regulator [Ulvibacter antarcticus]|uniref:histidine kinase n=1 Tax=Ulvibacter antarcticus TaxID=442714 RepID=A0A3L9YF36_9FLAO|nr:PAS domain-containing hybrid sensor histidine kinase/response regulator [Ulvibacter antarcticus]RMA58994.1 phospho-acceptor domain-containing protein [Ulvibacter antarcticus]